ncbi:hypothetical protein K4K61_005780 [Colletotrichum sp. SAR11_59]|uniref:Copper radical oxidase n=1 Tax=Colletotrichum asianum TaxID=702518 RepID=A0A8H3WHV9_9PEZI|nr:copper radical oxidase [Colletotrichum asianum]KAI8314119.1 hypothetical protein K4K61_005780 [Colletotrichum sp. SAR11_59]
MSFATFSRIGLMAMPLMAPLVSAAAVQVQPRGQLQARTFADKGCYSEPPRDHGRALKDASFSSDSMSTQMCSDFCKDYVYFATEYGRECYCGDVLTDSALPADSGDCNMPCNGMDDHSRCGGPGRLNLYQTDGYSGPSVKDLYNRGWSYLYCHTEGDGGRALREDGYSSDNMKAEDCGQYCSNKGFNFAGVEYGRECYCGSTIHGGSIAAEADCQMRCSGDAKSYCGSGGRLNIYARTVPGPIRTDPRATFTFAGCAKDTQTLRLLETGSRLTADDMDAYKCWSYCSNYKYFGVENGNECYCANTYSLNLELVSDSECGTPCFGNGVYTCGAKDRLNLYNTGRTLAVSVSTSQYSYVKCAQETPGGRALDGDHFADDNNMTVEMCASLCNNGKGATYFGLEFGKECFCGTGEPANAADESQCYYKCTGNSGELCGAPDRLSVYKYN